MFNKYAKLGVALSSSVAVILSSLSMASADPSTGGAAVGVTIGTLGLDGEISFKVVGNFVVRLEAGGARLSRNTTVDGNPLTGSVSGFNVGLIGDWHPFENGFRLSAGARYVNVDASATTSAANITLNGHTYTSAQYGVMTADIRNGNALGPYLGLGWDSAHYSGGGFAMSIDVGAIYLGNPKVALTATGNAAGLAADLAAEQQTLSSDASKYGRLYPVVQVGAKYRF